MNPSVRALRLEVFSKDWPLDPQITAVAAQLPSHSFLRNPSGQFVYIYLTRFVRAVSEHLLQRPFSTLSVLDWGCGKGHVSKLLHDLGPGSLESCDIASRDEDSAFGQDTPIISRFNIPVTPLNHEFELPYGGSTFDVVLSVGVLEHVADDRASLNEIKRVLKPGGLFFCFNLPTTRSWTQKVAHLRGNHYHDRLYDKPRIETMLSSAGMELLDLWHRQILPKNSVYYPNFRFFEKVDQFVTFNTPLRVFATSIEFVSSKR
jgi:2-polyprenyl-3-methyl-5-hydroxy-6-metoxy-1,4-benzoquinol methylase